MKLSRFKQPRPSTVPVDLGDGDQILVTYDRAIITNEWTSRTATRIERLSELLVSWDVTDDEGRPYQPDKHLNGERPAAWVALLKELPPDVLRCVEDHIWDDYYAGKPLGGGSSTT